MPLSLLIQHNDKVASNDWSLRGIGLNDRAQVELAIRQTISSLGKAEIKKYSLPNKSSILEREYDLGGHHGIWRLEAQEALQSDYSVAEGWIRHTYDLVPVSNPTMRRGYKIWSSLTWTLEKTPKKVHPPSQLFKKMIFHLTKAEYLATSDATQKLHLTSFIKSFGGSISPSLQSATHFLGSGRQSYSRHTIERHDGRAILVDVHWVYACIALSRRLPLKPYIISLTTPFTAPTTRLLHFPGYESPPVLHHYLSAPQRTPTTLYNARTEISVILVTSTTAPPHTFDAGTVSMRQQMGAPWDLPLDQALLRLFEDLGGTKTEDDRKASYFVGWVNSINAVIAIKAGAVNGSYSHFLHSVAKASMLPIEDSVRYKPLSPRPQIAAGAHLSSLATRYDALCCVVDYQGYHYKP